MQVRVHVGKELARALRPELEAVVAANDDPPGVAFSPEAAPAARRAVKNKALNYLSMLGDASVTMDLLKRYKDAENMTDQMAILQSLNDTPGTSHRYLGSTWITPLYHAQKSAKPIHSQLHAVCQSVTHVLLRRKRARGGAGSVLSAVAA